MGSWLRTVFWDGTAVQNARFGRHEVKSTVASPFTRHLAHFGQLLRGEIAPSSFHDEDQWGWTVRRGIVSGVLGFLEQSKGDMSVWLFQLLRFAELNLRRLVLFG